VNELQILSKIKAHLLGIKLDDKKDADIASQVTKTLQ
jgi:hypothetical protein